MERAKQDQWRMVMRRDRHCFLLAPGAPMPVKSRLVFQHADESIAAKVYRTTTIGKLPDGSRLADMLDVERQRGLCARVGTVAEMPSRPI